MDEAKKTLKNLEQRCKILQQQQVIFISALERTRENAHEKIKPVRNLAQVRNYLDNHCNNSTDKRMLSLFLEICMDLADFCVKLTALQSETRSARGLTEEAINLLSPTNDISGLRAKYPHDVVNHLSCDEARNFYGGVVSLIPITLDSVREAVANMERLQPRTQNMGSSDRLVTDQRNRKYSETRPGDCSLTQTTGVQTRVSQGDPSLQMLNKKKGYLEAFKPAWRPSGRFYTT